MGVRPPSSRPMRHEPSVKRPLLSQSTNPLGQYVGRFSVWRKLCRATVAFTNTSTFSGLAIIGCRNRCHRAVRIPNAFSTILLALHKSISHTCTHTHTHTHTHTNTHMQFPIQKLWSSRSCTQIDKQCSSRYGALELEYRYSASNSTCACHYYNYWENEFDTT